LSFVTLREILADCQREGWAVPAFDVINFETVIASLEGSAAERAPVILMVLPSHTPLSRWPGLVAMVQAQASRLDLPVCLHLDHAIDLKQVEAALDLGFSSVMIDGSTLPLADNICLTRQVVDAAHARGVSVEAELGHVGGGDEVLDEVEAASRLTPVGELSLQGTFSSGISSFPNVGDEVHLVSQEHLLGIFSAHSDVGFKVGHLTSFDAIDVHLDAS